jgi:hypothetical protein
VAPASPILLSAPPPWRGATGALRGLVAAMARQAGTSSHRPWSSARYCDGVRPVTSLKRALKLPRDVQTTATQASVTDQPRRRRVWARSIRRVIRYVYGVSL